MPVHLVSKSTFTAGGAANVARNIKRVGGEAILLGICGEDEGGRHLSEILEKDGIATDQIMNVTDRPTIRKMRVTSNSQQMMRIDWERVDPIDEKTQDALFDRLCSLEFDGIVVSDYGKGALPIRFLTKVLELAAKRKVPSIVDPKGHDYSRYLHSYLITPNRAEAVQRLG